MSNNLLHDYIAGAIGGTAGIIVGHPFDTVKVQLQTHKHVGNWGCIKTVWRAGVKSGFMRGLSFPLVGNGFLINTIYFGVYGNTLRKFTELRGHKSASYSDIFLAGSVAGASQLVVGCPSDVIKVTLQAQIKGSPSVVGKMDYFKGPRECIANLYREHGLRGFFRGFHIQAMRDVPTYGVYIFVYEWLNHLVDEHHFSDSSGIMGGLVGGGISGVVSWLFCLPFDTIKSRVQSDIHNIRYKGFIDCVQKSYKEDGLKVFMRGGISVALRAIPTNAITFLFYKKTMDYFEARTLHWST